MTTTNTAERQAARARALYGRGSGHEGHEHALLSYYDARAINLRHRNDREGLAALEKERREVAQFAASCGLSGQDLHTLLSVGAEHEAFRRSKETIEARRARTWEEGKSRHSGETGYREVLSRAEKLQTAFAQACPSLARRLAETGAAEAPEVVEICAKYEIPTQPTQETPK